MAFGRSDTDALFDYIKQVLAKSADIRRVDRINHNKDIDDKIIEELDSADFVISDLTYARPSVYWEAGYAQGRSIPVVYTARRDHIGKNATDDSLRVHFDLQMRNIIDWETPNADFARRLKSRVSLVSTPILARLAASEVDKEHRERFASLSQHNQIDLLANEASRYLKKSGFRLASRKKNSGEDKSSRTSQLMRRLPYAIRMSDETMQMCDVLVLPDVKKNTLSFYRDFVTQFSDEIDNLNIAHRPPKQVEVSSVFLSLTRVSPRLLRQAFPNATLSSQMTATVNGSTMFLPNAALWNSGKVIRRSYSSYFAVGKDRVRAEEDGTFLRTVVDGSTKERRVGSAIKAALVRHFKVIGGITDPSEVACHLARLLDAARTDRDS